MGYNLYEFTYKNPIFENMCVFFKYIIVNDFRRFNAPTAVSRLEDNTSRH